MPDRYTDAIVKYLAAKDYVPLKPRQLARQLGVTDEEYPTFREAVKVLRDGGRVVLGAKSCLMLPEISNRVVGTFRANPRGFGFVLPDTPNAHGDLYIPEGENGGAMSGDTVVARVFKRGVRGGEAIYHGRIMEILKRGASQIVGTLKQAEGNWFVLPDGKSFSAPVLIADVGPGARVGQKVVAEIVQYPQPGELARGVLIENLGAAGQIEAETQSIIYSYGLATDFDPAAIDEARRVAASFDEGAVSSTGLQPVPPRSTGILPVSPTGVPPVSSSSSSSSSSKVVPPTPPSPYSATADLRPLPSRERGEEEAPGPAREDLTGMTIATIDPPDARDFDDAVSLERDGDGYILGVHIADVSSFVAEGGDLDREARVRGNSVYFPRKVIPMLPEMLSNGVCSLQERRRRFCKSAFIRYDRAGNVTGTRLAETVISSAKRLNYREAQGIIDGQTGGYAPEVVDLLRRMDELARKIEVRRRAEGMIHLDLPAMEMVLDPEGKVVDAVAEDDSYTHTIIEMFMVEANEAVAGVLDARNIPFLRRIHPAPDDAAGKQLSTFVKVCGHKLPQHLGRADVQELLKNVKGRPEAYAVNLAVLKSFQQAEYSPMKVGHYALASRNYCHFTSPIRRYADLTIHRLFADVVRGKDLPPADMAELVQAGEHLSTTERRAESAEQELKTLLILQLLATKVGEVFAGVVTGVTNFGIFVQISRFGIEGLIRMDDLGDDWWEVSPQHGEVRGQRTGRKFRIGDALTVRIASVNTSGRQLNLALDRSAKPKDQPRPGKKKKKDRRR
jgi:ribonuclease R